MAIPHKIHQIWLQGKNSIPDKYQPFVDKWRSFHPQWQHTVWDDKSIRHLLTERQSWFMETYDGYRYLHQRVDSARYFILYELGGFYADMDTEPIQAMDSLIDKYPCADLLLPRQPFTNREEKVLRIFLQTKFILTNGVMASAPRHRAWDTLLQDLPRRENRMAFVKEAHITFSTGPAFLTLALDKQVRKDRTIVALPHYHFEPTFSYDYEKIQVDTSIHYVFHRQDATWHSPVLKFLLSSYFKVKKMFLKRKKWAGP